MIIYQVFTRLFGNNCKHPVHNGAIEVNGCGKLADFSTKALEQIRSLGVDYIWYTGLIEHATQTDYSAYGISTDHPAVVKGRAGSPYAIKDYFDIDPDLATKVDKRMSEFQNLVTRTHKAGLKMIIDFVPNHVARQYHSDACPAGMKDLGLDDDKTKHFSNQNNFYYLPNEALKADFSLEGYEEYPARVSGNDVFSSYVSRNDWYETVKLNYGVDYCAGRVGQFVPEPDTWHKMLSILLFWADKGVDGFRCDMAEMVPVEFWGWAIPQVKKTHPKILFIAEVYNPAEYRNYLNNGHFDYLYDKVGLYDTLRAVTCGQASTQQITHCWQSVEDIQEHMLNFLENHDEQRIASDFFAGYGLKGRPALLVSALMRTNPFMLYFGEEFGERGMEEEGFSGRDGRTTIFDYYPVSTIQRWRNGGKFDGTKLNEVERDLYSFHQTVLNLKLNNQTFSDGAFFDLMYVNRHLHQQYVFARKLKKEFILVVANFAEADVSTPIFVPQGLFECLGIKQLGESATNLITGKKQQLAVLPDAIFEVSVPAQNGVVLSFRVK